MKILNLYAGIGGNRKYWNDVKEDIEVIAIEHDPKIAKIYQDFFPNDKVIVADAHQYLLDHFQEFDFIWASPPCQTHSVMNITNTLSPYKDNAKQLAHGGGILPRYPKMELYQEIIFLTHHFKGRWCVENVIGYYEPLIKPMKMAKHYFWTNFILTNFVGTDRYIGHKDENKKMKEKLGFDLTPYRGVNKRTLLRNCVEPEVGKHIFNLAINPIAPNLSIFQ